jgi:pimeloyl-ACP methyl ester carboxylesterase
MKKLQLYFGNSVLAIVLVLLAMSISVFCQRADAVSPDPPPPGKLIDLGGHRLHVNCAGKGTPTVLVENGLGDFSFDWILVQSRVSRFTRICTYDRAGYAWSDPGPKPRTFSQINLEVMDALKKLGEHGPFVLVGHSYGGPVVRNFALTYPQQAAGVVLVDASFEGQRVGVGGKAMMRLGDGAKGGTIPEPHEAMKASDQPSVPEQRERTDEPLDPMYEVLPATDRKLQLWAQSLPEINDAENSQREWSGEYFAKWLATSQAGTLGAIPLVVLTRAEGGYKDGDYDIPAAELEKERKDGQQKLTLLSTNSKQVIVHSGHNMHLETPDDVTAAIRDVVQAVREQKKL